MSVRWNEKSYEMLWDCSSCGEKGLLGKTHRRCPSCGAAQDERTRRFPEKGEEVEARAHVFAGRVGEAEGGDASVAADSGRRRSRLLVDAAVALRKADVV